MKEKGNVAILSLNGRLDLASGGALKEEVKKLDVGEREEIEWRLEWLDGWQPEAFDLEAVRRRFDQ